MVMQTERWRELVSRKVGIIKEVAPQGRGSDEPFPPYLYIATLSHFDFRRAEKADRMGAGKGATEEEAISSAIGEAMERYCGFQCAADRIFLAKWSDLQAAAIPAEDFVLYSERQYLSKTWPYARWKKDADVAWINGVELPWEKSVAVPASLAYLVYPPPRIEDYFAPTTSNGMACGATLESAVLGGLCELMERDAFLITWMNRLPAIELELAHAGRLVEAIRQHYACFSVDVRCFLLPSDLPASVVMAISFDPRPDKPAQVVGLGCHPNPDIALRKALMELCQGRPSEAGRFADKPPHGRLTCYEDVRMLDDHSALAALPERRDEFAFLWARGTKARISDLRNPSHGNVGQDLEYCVAALTAKGCRVAYVDLTLPDLAGYDIHVVRAIATGLHPIHFGFGQERLGGRRLFELPRQLGFADRVRNEAELNPCPHPLA
jgi:ribosomal protein S12 methylthiotransferase accessory factor